MKICMLGKYPPIQGGVSKAVFYAAQELAQNGHEVHVLTQAPEVEPQYRMVLTKKDRKIGYGSKGKGKVIVHTPTPMNAPAYNHIPFSPAYESRLYAKGKEILSDQHFDVLIGWYFQPYGLVASWLSRESGVPLILIHAGSDLGRLAQHPELNILYREMCAQAKKILSNRDSEPGRLLAELGVAPDKIVENRGGNTLGPAFFEPHKPLNFHKYVPKAIPWISQLPLEKALKKALIASNQNLPNPDWPTIGIYGKVGAVKGHFDLLESLSLLLKKGLKVNFVTIPVGKVSTLSRFFTQILADKHLAKNSFILPPLAPWKIPRFIAACDAVCFLENGFDLEFHTPQIPLEILAGGATLICSREIAEKQFFAPVLQDGLNFIEIADPRKTSEFAAKLAPYLRKPQKLEAINRRGQITFEALKPLLGTENPIVTSLENAFAALPPMDSHASGLQPLEVVLTYRNPFIIDCFLKEYQMEREKAETIFQETLKWLYLGAYAKTQGGNPHPFLGIFEDNLIIDKMWHTFILCTKDYQDFCRDYLGTFIHHQPNSPAETQLMQEKFRENPEKMLAETRKELEEIMGYVYDVLGPETVEKWYRELPREYPVQKISIPPIDLSIPPKFPVKN